MRYVALLALVLLAGPAAGIMISDPLGDTSRPPAVPVAAVPDPLAGTADITSVSLALDGDALVAGLGLAESPDLAGSVSCWIDFTHDAVHHRASFFRSNQTVTRDGATQAADARMYRTELGVRTLKEQVGATLAGGFSARFDVDHVRGVSDQPLRPGAILSAIEAHCEQRPTTAMGLGPRYGSMDELDGAPHQGALPIVAGGVELTSPRPVIASDGAEIVVRFQLNVEAQESGTYPVSIGGVPSRWHVAAVAKSVTLAAGEQASFPVFAAMPFAHRHGSTEMFEVAVGDARIDLGVHFRGAPHPTGHHNVVYGHHWAADLGEDPFLAAMALYFQQIDPLAGFTSTLADDPGANSKPQAKQFDEASGAGNATADQLYRFHFPLNPPLSSPLNVIDGGRASSSIAFDVGGVMFGASLNLQGRLHDPRGVVDPIVLFDANGTIDTGLVTDGTVAFEVDGPANRLAMARAGPDWVFSIDAALTVNRPLVDQTSFAAVSGRPETVLPLEDELQAWFAGASLILPRDAQVPTGTPTAIHASIGPGLAGRYDVVPVGIPHGWRVTAPATVDVGADGDSFVLVVEADEPGVAEVVILAVPEAGSGDAATLQLTAFEPVVVEDVEEESPAPAAGLVLVLGALAARRRLG